VVDTSRNGLGPPPDDPDRDDEWCNPGRLLRAGVQYAQGFSVNVANRLTTKQSYQWGRELSDLLGHREFVVDTSRNGLGPPPDDPDRDDEWCNPGRQALGQAPTTRASMPGLAALLWIKLPGESDGICGGETTYLFSPRQARRLTVNSPFVPIEDRRLAEAAVVPANGDDEQELVSATAHALPP